MTTHSETSSTAPRAPPAVSNPAGGKPKLKRARLTDGQLQVKRRKDREAQKSHRERNKQRLEEFEHLVSELTEQNAKLRQENARLHCLTSSGNGMYPPQLPYVD